MQIRSATWGFKNKWTLSSLLSLLEPILVPEACSKHKWRTWEKLDPTRSSSCSNLRLLISTKLLCVIRRQRVSDDWTDWCPVREKTTVKASTCFHNVKKREADSSVYIPEEGNFQVSSNWCIPFWHHFCSKCLGFLAAKKQLCSRGPAIGMH